MKNLAEIFLGVKQRKNPAVNLMLRFSITQTSEPEQSGCDTV
jgi:hypothetical protein